MREIFFLFLLFHFTSLSAQKLVSIPDVIDIGKIEEAGSVKSHVVLQNQSDKTVFLFRTEGPKELETQVKKKNLVPGDTLHLNLLYTPKKAGKFSSEIKLYHSLSDKPLTFKMKGEIGAISINPLQACVSFDPSNSKNKSVPLPILASHKVFFADAANQKPVLNVNMLYVNLATGEKTEFTSNSGGMNNAIPLGNYALVVKAEGYEPFMGELMLKLINPVNTYMLHKTKPKPLIEEEEKVVPVEILPVKPEVPLDPFAMDEREFAPNNIVFLIDISGSMRNEDCLPVLKESMKTLMKPIRAVDKISIITYASEVNMLANGIKGNEKQMLLQKIDSLKAEGLTAGSQGMRIAYEICRENYIPKGNNQIILATDGAFRLSKIERKKVKDAAEDELPIRLTVTGFGQNQKALDILRELSAEGQGSFIPVQNAPESRSMLLDEIKFRSALKK